MTKQSIAAFALIALIAHTAKAQQKVDMFTALDANKDNILTQEEFLANAKQTFSSFDKNSDGKVDIAERDAQRKIWENARKSK